MQCRICRTSENLKYSRHELGKRKKETANICWDCEERLLNFDKLDDELSANGENENTVIVDDDALLYSSFFDRKTKTIQSDRGERKQLKIKQPLETIEVLTSRENTPERLASPLLTIDLESEDENNDKQTLKNNIYFKGIESIDVSSSDSDVEVGSVEFRTEPCSKHIPEIISTSDTLHPCSSCDKKFSTEYALKSHSQNHNLVNCPKCPVIFTCSLKLVRHIRTQHRTYSGNIVSEKPKLIHDSEMTIRLRYMSRYNYYECNLCGQIDSRYATHRQHVLGQHAEECKRLDNLDPVVIKCPICYEELRNLMQLCRHFRQSHRGNYGNHLKNIKHPRISDIPWQEQRVIAETSSVYQLIGRPSHYFECNMCENICVGHFNHWKHLRTHDLSNGKRKHYSDSMSASHSDNKLSSILRPKKKKIGVNFSNKSNAVKKSKKDQIISCHKPSNKSSKTSSKSKPLRKLNYRPLIGIDKPVKYSKKPTEKIVKTIVNQKYCCKFCSVWFVGYKSWNMHLIFAHPIQEFGQLLNTSGDVQNFSHRRKYKTRKSKQSTTTSTCENKNPESSEENSVLTTLRSAETANQILTEKNQIISKAYQCPYRQLCRTSNSSQRIANVGKRSAIKVSSKFKKQFYIFIRFKLDQLRSSSNQSTDASEEWSSGLGGPNFLVEVEKEAKISDLEYVPSISLRNVVNATNQISSPKIIVRPGEILIVSLVLILWVGAIILFFNRWGKIRMLEPYQPKFQQHHRTSCPLIELTSVLSHQRPSVPRMSLVLTNPINFPSYQLATACNPNIYNGAYSSPCYSRPRQNSVFVGSSLSQMIIPKPTRRACSVMDLHSMNLDETSAEQV